MQKFSLLISSVLGISVLLTSCGLTRDIARRRYFDEGKAHFTHGKYREASIAFRKAIQKDPEFGDAYYQLALAELKPGGAGSRALGALRRAMVLLPANEDIKVKLAELYMYAYLQQGAIEQYPLKEAKQIAGLLLSRDPKSWHGLCLSGHVASLGKQPTEAIRYFTEADKVKPHDPETMLALGLALAQAQQYTDAERQLSEVIRLRKQSVPAYRTLYSLYTKSKRLTEAEAILKLRTANLPADPMGYLELAGHYFRLQKTSDMQQALSPLLSDGKTFPQGRLMMGDFYRSTGNIAEARKLYEAGLQANAADKVEYRKRLGSLLMLEGKRDEAVKTYESVVKEAPKDRESRENRAALLLQDDADTAVKEFQALVKETPNNPLLWYNLGLAYMAKRDTGQARTSFLEASRRQRDFLPARLGLARISLDTGAYKEVQKYSLEVLAVNPTHPEARYYLAAAQTGMGSYFDAHKTLNVLIKDYPQYHEPKLQLALLNLLEKKYKEAEAELQSLYQSSHDVRGLNGLIQLQFAQNQTQKAFDLAEGELKKNPDSDSIRVLLAQTALRSNHYPRAIEELIRLAEKDPNWDYLYIRLGEAHQLNGDLGRAVLAFRKATELSPKNLEAVLRLSYAYEVAGDIPKAVASYRQALAIDPNIPLAMNNLAYLLTEHGGDLDEAQLLAQAALQRMPQQKYVADTVGWIFLKKKEVEAAFQIFSSLVRKYPEEPTFHYHFGAALLAKGDRVKAKTELQTALDRNPTPDQEKKIRELIGRLG